MQDTPETPGRGGSDPSDRAPTPPPTPPEAMAAPPPPPPAVPTTSGGTVPQPHAAVGKGLFDRARDIIIRPSAEWRVIDAEPATVGSVFVPYALILAAIGPIAGFIGGQVFGIPLGFFTWHPPIGGAIIWALVSYALALGSIYVLALIIDALAPTFGGTKNQVNAVKVAVYSWTAAWLAGIFGLIPALAILALVGLYSLYLLYLGLPVLMKSPPDRAVGYTAVVILAAIVLWVIVGWLAYRLVFSMLVGPIVPGIG